MYVCVFMRLYGAHTWYVHVYARVHMRLCRCMSVYVPVCVSLCVCVCFRKRQRNYLRKSSQKGSVRWS